MVPAAGIAAFGARAGDAAPAVARMSRMKKALPIALALIAFAANTASAAAEDLIDCEGGGAIPFTMAAFNQPRNAENGSTSEAVALRNYLNTNSAAAGLPKTGWFELKRQTSDANDYVRYGNGSVTTFRNLLFVRVAGGPWRPHPTFGQQCVLRKLFSDGRASTPWNVVPNRLPIKRSARSLWVQMTETACASGRPADGRVSVPVIVYEPTQITLMARIAPSSGTQTCQANPPTYLKVELSQPIGSRALIDGGSVPSNSRLSRTQLKRIRQGRKKSSILMFTRSQQEICQDAADNALTIPGLALSNKQRARLRVLDSRCPS